MQKLMRHSDPKLTVGIYTHVFVADMADELAKLPSIGIRCTEAEHAAKTENYRCGISTPPKKCGQANGQLRERLQSTNNDLQ